MPSNHLILCHPLLLLPSIFPSIRVFSNESVLCIRLPKYWRFSFSISPSNEYSGLISFRVDQLDLLAVQGILESSPTPQFKKASPSYKQNKAFFCPFILKKKCPHVKEMESLMQWTQTWANSRELVRDREAWRAAVLGVSKSRTRPSD